MDTPLEQTDQLLECLVFLSKFYAVPNSRDAMLAGLPLPQGRLTTTLFPRAAESVGLSAQVEKRSFHELSPLLLPAVIMLRDGGACVLLELDPEHRRARVALPLLENAEQELAFEQLTQLEAGEIILVKRAFRYDARSPKVLESGHGHWFWGTLLSSLSIYRDVLIASVLINLFAVASPLFTMNVYDKIVPNLAFDSLWVLSVGVTIVFAFDVIMRQLRSHFIDIAGKKSDVLLSARIFAKVMGIRMEARPASTGAFAKHLQEFESIREFFTSATVSTLVDLPFAFFFLFIIWVFAGYMAVIPLIAIIVMTIYSLYIQGPLRRSIEEGSRLASQ